MKHITKLFPGVLANDDISIEVDKGEVYTLLGENGAGKSTLMNILCGLSRPTSGEIFIEGVSYNFHSAKDAMNIGIGMVHQHFMLIPRLSVVENCLIGHKSEDLLKLDIDSSAKKISSIAQQFHMNIDPFALIEKLSVGERQRVEIIKALFRGAKILILDEPTSVLTPQETQDLFRMICKLTDEGYTVLFISHKLKEVMEISDKVTVLQSGRVVGKYRKQDCSINMLAREMVGRDVVLNFEQSEHKLGKTVLQVEGLTLLRDKKGNLNTLDNISFDIHQGEIFGIAGVDGNGQSELVECLSGLRKASAGTAIFEEKNLLLCSTRKIMGSGISHIPQDRQGSGLILSMNITENLIIQDYYKDSFGKGPFLDWNYANNLSEGIIREYNIKTPDRYEAAQNLSGGNQQKIILAREISRKPTLLLAMHPTRGLDVGAIEYIHNTLIKKRDEGLAILLVSTELEEVMKLSDRICVMYEGKIMGVVKPKESSVEQIGLMMGGTKLDSVPTLS